MRAEGYGADLEFDGTTITIWAGRATAKIQRATVVRVPVADVVAVKVRAANALINGELRLDVGRPPGVTLRELVRIGSLPADDLQAIAAAHGPEVAQWVTRVHSYGLEQPNCVSPESLVVHWRRKDDPAFAPIVEAIRAAVSAPAV